MNKYVYVGVFEDPDMEPIMDIPVCFENEKILAETEEDAYNLGWERLKNRISNSEEGYIKYLGKQLINDYVVKIDEDFL